MPATAVKTTITVGPQDRPGLPIELEHDPELSRWTGVLQIATAMFHVDAIEVREEGSDKAVSREMQSTADAYGPLNDGLPETIDIHGRPHLVLIYPFEA